MLALALSLALRAAIAAEGEPAGQPAGEPAGLELRWEAPPRCPDRAQLLAAIDATLGAVEGERRPLRVHGRVDVDPRAGFVVRLELDDGRASTRDLRGPSCEELTDAAALVIAMTIDPRLLYLDEPASGLDPRARIEFRALLKELAANGKGILISSHILSELGETCDSVVVIERGRRQVAGSIAEIQKSVQHEQAVSLRVLRDAEAAHRFLLVQPGVTEVTVDGSRLRFAFAGDDTAMGELLARAIAGGIAVVEFSRTEADLEDIFLRTTKGKLQ